MNKKVYGSEKIFNMAINLILLLFGLIALYPLIFVVSASVSDPTAVNSGRVTLLPVGFNLKGYQAILKSKWIITGYRNSLFYTVSGTVLNVTVTLMAGYALSRRDLYGRRLITLFMMFTMWFSGGIITTYLVVNKIGLYNKWYTLILIGLVSVYNVIITRSFISGSIPMELQEAARIDGCNDFQIFARLIIPLSKPVTAILCLYYGLGHWNSYFNALIYLKDKNMQPLQIFLREILVQNETIHMSSDALDSLIERALMAQTMKYSLIVVASLPMLMIYPFLQKFFVKGVMIGSVKG
ncbi:MAG: carbohydrate ABC transporter permease [Hungatella sp.]|nr:carbohydrate ABC transporter permease [Hungatella sp.]